MPYKYVSPEVAYEHENGRKIYHEYSHDNVYDRSAFWFNTSSDEDADFIFDVRDLHLPKSVVESWSLSVVLKYAIDNGLLKFPEDE